MTTRTSPTLKQAFKRFVELVRPIEDVQYVVAFDDDELDFYTFITQLDDAVSSQVHEAEFQIMDNFPDLLVEFHVRYLEGRSPESFVGQLPTLSYSRGSDVKRYGHTVD